MSRARWTTALVVVGLALVACGGKLDSSDPAGGIATTTSSGGASGTSGGSSGSSGVLPPPTGEPLPPPPSTGKPGRQPPPSPCGVSFNGEVMKVLSANGCSDSSCHGGSTPASLPRIDLADPPATYKSLLSYKLDGRPYVSTSGNPSSSAMYCNLRHVCGTPMPVDGKVPSHELAWIDAWLACGAPFN